jgi:hypothetical protein
MGTTIASMAPAKPQMSHCAFRSHGINAARCSITHPALRFAMIPATNPIRAKKPITLVLGLILSHLASIYGLINLNLTNMIMFTAIKRIINFVLES